MTVKDIHLVVINVGFLLRVDDEKNITGIGLKLSSTVTVP
jgi:hypothetical protein